MSRILEWAATPAAKNVVEAERSADPKHWTREAARPDRAASEQEALGSLRGLNKALSKIKEKNLNSEDALRRLWDGMFSAPRDTREYWELHQESILKQAHALKDRLAEHAREVEASVSAEDFQGMIKKSSVVVKEPGLGKAELNNIDKRRMIRSVPQATELSVYFIDEYDGARESKHLRQIIARQFFMAGTGRMDSRKSNGRNTVIAWLRNGKVVSTEMHVKPPFWTSAWWKNYWWAIWQRPIPEDYVFAIVVGGITQGLLAWALSGVKLALFGIPILYGPILFTIIFGTVIGIFISLYINWTQSGKWYKRVLKSAVVSLLFAYPLIAFMEGAGSLNLLHAKGWGMHAHILSNAALNNTGKVIWQQRSKLGDDHRMYTKPLFGLKIRGKVMNQIFYTINWFFRLVDLMGIPYGKLIYILSWMPGYYWAYQYAKKNGFDEAEQMRPRALFRRLWNKLRGISEKIPSVRPLG